MNDLTDDQLTETIRAAGWGDPAFPLALAGAVELLRGGGQFDVDPDTLTDLANRGLIPPLPAQWGPRDVIAVAGVLDVRRQWRAAPSVHDAKKHPTRLLLEQHGPEVVTGSRHPRPDLRWLLVLLVETDQREMREKLLSSLAAELATEHGIRL